MAKRLLKISEILAKKSGQPPQGAALDFIAESQNIINQYTKESVHSSETELFESITKEIPFIELKNQTAQLFNQIEDDLISSVGDTNDTSLNALTSPIPNTDSPPSNDIGISEIGDFKEKPENVQQTYNKPTSQHTTNVLHNLQQTPNKPTSNNTTNIQQTYNSKGKTYNKLTSEPTTVVQQKSTTVVLQNVQQTHNKPTSNRFAYGVNRLSGQRLRILNYLFDLCISNGSRLSGPVSVEALALAIECNSLKTIQTVVYRLEKDGYVLRSEFKAGRGGWTSYEIPQDIYNQMLQHTSKPTTNLLQNIQQLYNKPTSQPTSEPTSTAPSKIDSKNYNNLTNYLENNPTTTTWFKELDFSKVSPIGPMMVNATIRSLVQQKLNPEIVQDFINRFTSWVATQSRVSNAVGLFCDKLKELANEGDSPVLACMTEEERQVEVAYAAQVEKARLELELIQKARAIEQEKAKEADFEKWYSTATESEKDLLVPTSKLAPEGSEVRKGLLKASYFSKEQS
jgi:hypothetical protein